MGQYLELLLSVCKWLGGLPVVFRFSLWSAAVVRFLGVWCYRIGFSMWALSKLFSDTFILLYSTVNSTGSRAIGVAKMQFIGVAS